MGILFCSAAVYAPRTGYAYVVLSFDQGWTEVELGRVQPEVNVLQSEVLAELILKSD